MFRRPLWLLVVLGACAGANPGSAETLEPSVLSVARPAFAAGPTFAAPPPGAVYEVRRRPRYAPPPRERTRGERPVQGWLTLRGGIFEGDDIPRDQWTIGVKGVGYAAPNVRLGLSLDLHRRSDTQGTIVSEFVDPAGNRVTQEITTGRTETNLVPLLGLIEFAFPSGSATRPVTPYVGAGLGWEFLNVRVRDYDAGLEYETDYDGPGYQLYGGLELPLAKRAQFNVETYWNGGRVEQEFYDLGSGITFDERIRTHGWGVRGGLGFAF